MKTPPEPWASEAADQMTALAEVISAAFNGAYTTLEIEVTASDGNSRIAFKGYTPITSHIEGPSFAALRERFNSSPSDLQKQAEHFRAEAKKLDDLAQTAAAALSPRPRSITQQLRDS